MNQITIVRAVARPHAPRPDRPAPGARRVRVAGGVA